MYSVSYTKKNCFSSSSPAFHLNNFFSLKICWFPISTVYYQFCSTCSNRVRSEFWINFQNHATNPNGRYTSSLLPIFNSSIFFFAIFEYRMSMGWVVSYKLGAWHMIMAEPKTQANANIHRNNRSNTMATYFQSSSTWNEEN